MGRMIILTYRIIGRHLRLEREVKEPSGGGLVQAEGTACAVVLRQKALIITGKVERVEGE